MRSGCRALKPAFQSGTILHAADWHGYGDDRTGPGFGLDSEYPVQEPRTFANVCEAQTVSLGTDCLWRFGVKSASIVFYFQSYKSATDLQGEFDRFCPRMFYNVINRLLYDAK